MLGQGWDGSFSLAFSGMGCVGLGRHDIGFVNLMLGGLQ